VDAGCAQGDQASIIGGAINYVKELEQLLQSLEARKHARRQDLSPGAAGCDADAAAGPFAGFFTFPQYSMSAGAGGAPFPATANTPPADGEGRPNNADADGNHGDGDDAAASGSRPSSVADVEVTMVESHASLKLLSRRRPRQLLRLVAGLQGHRLTVLHLNATSDDARRMALYSLSLKVRTAYYQPPSPAATCPGLPLPAPRLVRNDPSKLPLLHVFNEADDMGAGTGRGLQERRPCVPLFINVSAHDDLLKLSVLVPVRRLDARGCPQVEDDCALSSVDDIAAAVHGIVEAVDREEGGGAELHGSHADDDDEEE